MRPSALARSLAACLLALPLTSAAMDAVEEAERLYEVEVLAPSKMQKGQSGELVVHIKPKAGAEIHKEAPVSLALEARRLEATQKKLGRKELKMEGGNGSFTVPLTATEAGEGALETNLTFFICTDKVCARQQRKATTTVIVSE